MKKITILLLLLGFFIFCSSASAIESEYERNKVYRPYEVEGWHICVIDDDIDAAAELITELDSTYLQLTSGSDTLEVVSSDSSDTTQTVTITGTNSSEKVSTTFELNGDVAICDAQIFEYIDQVSVDAECVGTITIRRSTNDVFITSIPAGILNAGMAQHFNGGDKSYVTGWSCGVLTTTGDVLFELRWYPDENDSRCFLTGYVVLDEIFIEGAVTSPYNVVATFPQPIKLPAGGWLAVFGTGSTANCDGKVVIQGYDSKRY